MREGQLLGHLESIASYRRKALLVLSPDRKEPAAVQKLRRAQRAIYWYPWTDVHRWAVNSLRADKNARNNDPLLLNLKGYLEMNEKLSGFQGIDFHDGYDRIKAKNVLKVLMDELHPKIRKLYPELVTRRDAITTEGTAVWDCFGIRPFTADLHFTVSIEESRTVINLTLPNKASTRWRRLKQIPRDPALNRRFLAEIIKMRKESPELWIRLAQRHFKGRRNVVPDAILEFNADTTNLLKSTGPIKSFPVWFKAVTEAIESKAGVNLQLQFQARFVHKDFSKTSSREFIQVAFKMIRSFRDLYKLLRS